MKRLLISGLSVMVVVLFACNDKAGDAADGNDDKRKEMLESNRQVLKAIETGDSATIHKYIADDAVDHGASNGADMKGPDIVTMLADAHNSIDNLKFEVLQEAANDDHIFCMARMTGDVKKPIWGMPVGKVDMTSVDVIKIKDGKMTDHWSYMNPADMMKMMPPPNSMQGDATHANMGTDTTKK